MGFDGDRYDNFDLLRVRQYGVERPFVLKDLVNQFVSSFDVLERRNIVVAEEWLGINIFDPICGQAGLLSVDEVVLPGLRKRIPERF